MLVGWLAGWLLLLLFSFSEFLMSRVRAKVVRVWPTALRRHIYAKYDGEVEVEESESVSLAGPGRSIPRRAPSSLKFHTPTKDNT